MSEPSVTKPAKKAQSIPKNANGHAITDEKPAVGQAASAANAPDVQAAPAKTAAQKRVKPVEAAPARPAVEAKARHVKKEKVVRDSFTMPKSDYEKIAALKQKCLAAGVSVKKSELLRAGLLLLDSAPTLEGLLTAISAVATVKTGRPAKS